MQAKRIGIILYQNPFSAESLLPSFEIVNKLFEKFYLILKY